MKLTATIASTVSDTPIDEHRDGAASDLAQVSVALEKGDTVGAAVLLNRLGESLDRLDTPEHTSASADQHEQIARREMPDAVDDMLIYDGYFGIERTAALTASEQAAVALPVVRELVHRLSEFALTPDAMAALTTLCSDLLAPLGKVLEGGEPIPAGSRSPGVLSPLERWKLGHLLYGLANRASARHVDRALAAVESGAHETAAGELLQAGRGLDAVTATMDLAASMSSLNYCQEVRPTMCPPHLEVELAGPMNADHRALRKAIAKLRHAIGGPYHELAAVNVALADARDLLLHLDLGDLERHIALTLRLVGSIPALDEGINQSAVQSLRALYLERLGEYSRMLRHGRSTEPGGET